MSTAWQEQEVPITEIDTKYEHIVDNIIRDKSSGWRNDYYRDTYTGYDTHVARAQAQIHGYKHQIKKYENELEKIATCIENSKRAVDDPKYKKLTPKAVDALEEDYSELYKQKCEQMVFLDGAEKIKQQFEWKQYLQVKRLVLLQSIRNKFMVDGDEDYMKRGVTWVSQYIEKLRLE